MITQILERYLLVISILLIFMEIYLRIAKKFGIMDVPNSRSSHNNITIRGGGAIFFIAFTIGIVFFGTWSIFLFYGLVLITFISFLDDLFTVPFSVRLGVHIFAMLIMLTGINFYSLHIYYLPIAIIMGLAIVNAYNFMDGINGMTGVYNLVVFSSFWYINNFVFKFTSNNLLYIMMIALIIFNVYNSRKSALCFSGDVGSVSLAFIVVFVIGQLIIKTGDIFYLTLLMVYGVETLLTISYRIRQKENIFMPHRKHMFQILTNELKFSHITVSISYAAVQLLISIGYLVFYKHNVIYSLLVFILLTLTYILFMNSNLHLHKHKE